MSTTPREREVKLSAAVDFSLARLPRRFVGYVAAPAEFRRLHTIYYDSNDLRLARWGCCLRYRVGEGWMLKLVQPSAEGALVRKQYRFDGGPHDVPKRALDIAFAYLRGAEVSPVAELRTLRTTRAIRQDDDGDVVADVVDDDVRVVSGSSTQRRFRQVGIEKFDGDSEAVDALRAALQRSGAGGIERQWEVQRALGDRVDPELPRRTVGKSSSGEDVFVAAFGSAVEKLVRLDAALRSEWEPHVLHEMRTAVRRLRSYLRSFRRLLDPGWAETLRERLAWINRLMADARNSDVLIDSLERRARELEPADAARAPKLFERLTAERASAYEAVRAGLRESRYAALVDEIIAAARSPRVRPRANKKARRCKAAVIRGARKRLCRAVSDMSTPPTEHDLHAVRIKAKHVRFAAEAFTAVCGKGTAALARSAKALQTILGEQHDAVVALRHLRRLSDGADLAFVGGQLAEQSRVTASHARRRWRRALDDVL